MGQEKFKNVKKLQKKCEKIIDKRFKIVFNKSTHLARRGLCERERKPVDLSKKRLF